MSVGGCALHEPAPIAVVTLEKSFVEIGSKLVPATSAVLVTEPEVAVTLYEAVMVTLCPLTSVPIAQGKPVMHGAVADANVKPDAVGSLRTTFVAVAGPLLVTVI